MARSILFNATFLSSVILLLPLLKIFQLYRGHHLYWWKKPENQKESHRPATSQENIQIWFGYCPMKLKQIEMWYVG